MAQAGQGPMRRPEEGGWEGLRVHRPRPNRGQLALRAQTGPLPWRLLFLLIFFLFILIVRVVHQTNQSGLRDTRRETTKNESESRLSIMISFHFSMRKKWKGLMLVYHDPSLFALFDSLCRERRDMTRSKGPTLAIRLLGAPFNM